VGATHDGGEACHLPCVQVALLGQAAAREEGEAMTDQDRHAIAAAIVDTLFQNGSGQQAQRLVLTVDRPTLINLGGWSRAGAKDQIERVIAVRLKELDRNRDSC
jgi:hypothetical protein